MSLSTSLAAVQVRPNLSGFCSLGFPESPNTLLWTVQLTCQFIFMDGWVHRCQSYLLQTCSWWPWLPVFHTGNFLMALFWEIHWEQLSCCIWPWPLLILLLPTSSSSLAFSSHSPCLLFVILNARFWRRYISLSISYRLQIHDHILRTLPAPPSLTLSHSETLYTTWR